ncbi:MAG: c-type cytochrome [Solirubrobacteraceae bacterium]|jgi:mono/diheme cytochrome c family protein|nr:c-type cytochrome [Solirubrobacteraceae bacterium]
MLAVTAVIIAFVLAGLIAVGAGFAGRRRKADEPEKPPSNKLLYTGLALITVGLGLLVPAVLLVDNGEDRAKEAVGGVELTSAQEKGRELFAQNCSSCHTLQASNAVGQTGPNLDALKPPEALTLNAIKLGRARGAGNMPAGLLSGEAAEDVASYVAAVAGRGEGLVTEEGSPEPPATAGGGGDQAAEGESIFTQNCASCHTLKAAGANGNVGPVLDTLKPSEPTVSAAVTKGKGAMPAFEGQLTPEQIKAVAAYVAESAGK